MSIQHLQSVQKMIEELESFGYKDVTDTVKEFYGHYLYLCTLDRPEPDQEQGPIYCETVNDLLSLLELVNPSRLELQAWFCEICQITGFVRYRKGAGPTEVVESIEHTHRNSSPTCVNSPYGIRVINSATIVSCADLDGDATIPEWAKGPLTNILFASNSCVRSTERTTS